MIKKRLTQQPFSWFSRKSNSIPVPTWKFREKQPAGNAYKQPKKCRLKKRGDARDEVIIGLGTSIRRKQKAQNVSKQVFCRRRRNVTGRQDLIVAVASCAKNRLHMLFIRAGSVANSGNYYSVLRNFSFE